MKVWRLFLMILCLMLLSACQLKSDDNDSQSKRKQSKVKDESRMEQQLINSAESGDTKEVLQFINNGADINGTDKQGRTAVMAATENHKTETVKKLIQQGADVNIRNDNEDNVLLYAGAEGDLDILKLAIDAEADTTLTNRYGGTALIPASERGHVAIVKELLTHSDVDVNHVNHLNWTALLEAIILGDGKEKHQKIVQLLVKHGADVNISDGDGITPLEHAKQRGFTKIERILKEAGA